MSESCKDPLTSRRAGSKPGTAFFFHIACSLFAAFGIVWVVLAVFFASEWWIADKFRAFGVLGGMLLLVAAFASSIISSRLLALPLIVCAAILWWTAYDAPRAQWVGGSQPEPGSVVVRVVTFNALASNANIKVLYDRISEIDADVVTILEAPHDLIAMIRDRDGVPGKFDHWDAAEPGHWWNVIRLSRWPLSWAEVPRDETFRERRSNLAYRRSLVVLHPEQHFLLTAVFPDSPRSGERWERGNAELRLFGQVIQDHFRPSGLPMVVCSDMNASLSGYRTRLLTEVSGLRRAKPWWIPAGSWPSLLPAVLRVPIDDVLVSSGIGVREWRVLGWSAGSDHAPVLVELALPRTEIEVPEHWLAGTRAPDRHLGADRR